MSRRLVTPEVRDDDVAEPNLRPQRLSEFIGQEKACANLSVFIAAAKKRKEALDRVLLVGPPGLGKTTLAQIVARELAVNFRATSGPVIAKAGDLAALLTNLEDRDVLFIDEIHRLNPAVEEILYPALEDFQLDLIIGEGRGCSVSRSHPKARVRSRGAPAARRGSRDGCFAACATSHPSRGLPPSMPRSPTVRCRSSRSTVKGSMRSITAICA